MFCLGLNSKLSSKKVKLLLWKARWRQENIQKRGPLERILFCVSLVTAGFLIFWCLSKALWTHPYLRLWYAIALHATTSKFVGVWFYVFNKDAIIYTRWEVPPWRNCLTNNSCFFLHVGKVNSKNDLLPISILLYLWTNICKRMCSAIRQTLW